MVSLKTTKTIEPHRALSVVSPAGLFLSGTNPRVANCFAAEPTLPRACSLCVQGPALFSRKAGPFSTQRGSKLETIQGDLWRVKVAFTPAQFYLFAHVAAYPSGREPAGFIAPCLPTKTDKLPSGSLWLHEIKDDGLRIIARKTGAQVRLYSRPDNDLTRRFPLIVEALARLRSGNLHRTRNQRLTVADGRAGFWSVSFRQGRYARGGKGGCCSHQPVSRSVSAVRMA